MSRFRECVKAVAPSFIKGLYRRARAGLSSSALYSPWNVEVCVVRSIEIKIGVLSPLEDYRAKSYATKEPETLDWLEDDLRDNDVFMDIGANIGLYSLYAAKLSPSCTVFSFEPEAQNYSRLCNNIVLNGVSNIVPCNFPLSDREAFDFFYVREKDQ